MSDANDTRVRLPHTGLWVPDRRLSVTAYKELSSPDGVAFTANLRVGGRVVGLIYNEGMGGPTTFYPDPTDRQRFGDAELAGYAERCRTEEGGPVTVERLLDELVEEHDWTRKAAAAARKGRTLLRLMDHILDGDGPADFPPYPQGSADSATPRNDRQWEELAKQVTASMDPGPYGWWQAWTGQGWRDVTPRPACVDPERYL